MAIVDVSKGGRSFRNSIVWEGNGGSDLPGARKSLPGRLHGNYKMNFIQDNFQRLSQKSKRTSHDSVWKWHKNILFHTKKFVCKTLLKEATILLKCRETFWNIIAACNAYGNAAVPQVFSCHILGAAPK